MYKQKHFDAFTGISISEKSAIVNFLQKNLEFDWIDKSKIVKSVEYAIKEIPSFGGFILTAEENQEIVAALIVNKTGLSGLMPEYIVVLQTTKPIAKGKIIERKLAEKAIQIAKGDISLLIKDFGPKELMLENMTLEAKFMPLTTNTESVVKATA